MNRLDGRSRSAGLDADNPWPGLAPFGEADARYFHGREAAVDALARLVGREELALLYGGSGLGKTSLLRAGLFPRLPASVLPVYVRLHFDITVHQGAGADALRQQVLDAVGEQASDPRRDIEMPPAGATGTLWEFFRRRDQPFWGPGAEIVVPLLVFDQFEQLFRCDPQRGLPPAEVDAFLEDLGDTLFGRVPRWLEAQLQSSSVVDRYVFESTACKAIISFREEYLADVKRLRMLVPSTDRNSFRLEPLHCEEAVRAVEQAGSSLIAHPPSDGATPPQSPVARAIVERVAGSGQGEDATVDPAILSVFCTELNDARKRRAAEGGPSTIDLDLVRSKQSEQIIENYYHRAVVGTPEVVRRFIEDRLILASGARNSVAVEEVDEARLPPEAITSLVEEWRILRREVVGRQGQVRLELTHDVLVAPVMADRRARDENERRAAVERQRSLRWLAALTAVALGLVVMGFALHRVSEETRRLEWARSAALGVESQRKGATQPIDGLLLAIEAAEAGATPEADAALRQALARTYPRTLLASPDLVDGAFSPDASQFVTVGRSRVIRVWDLEHETTPIEHTQEGQPQLVRMLSDGRIVVASDTRAVVWDTRGSARPLDSAGAVLTAAIDDRGHWLAVAGTESGTVVWRVDGEPTRVETAGALSHDVAVLAFDGNATRLLELSAAGTVRIRDLEKGNSVITHTAGGRLTAGDISHDGRHVALAGAHGLSLHEVGIDRLVDHWRVSPGADPVWKVALLTAGQRTRVVALGAMGVTIWDDEVMVDEFAAASEAWSDIAVSADGGVLALAGNGGSVRVRRGDGSESVYRIDQTPLLKVVVSPDGRLVAGLSESGFVSVWDVHVAAAGTLPTDFQTLLQAARDRMRSLRSWRSDLDAQE